MEKDKNIEEDANFEKLIESSKQALNQLNSADLSLKESLEIYKRGLENLNKAQKLLEEAKLEYQALNPINP